MLTAIDRNKSSFTKPVGFGGLERMMWFYCKGICILITDGNRNYRNLNNVKVKSLKFEKAENKVYHLNTINSFHSH